MRISFVSGVRNDLLQEIADQTLAIETSTTGTIQPHVVATWQRIVDILAVLEGSQDTLLTDISAQTLETSTRIISSHDFVNQSFPTFTAVIKAGFHVSTSRLTYTVPASRRCKVGSVYALLARHVVATTALGTGATLKITESGGAASNIFAVERYLFSINDASNIHMDLNYTLEAGDKIEYFTHETSGTGSSTINIGASLVEYDV